jgi:hypothetical protein
MGLLVSLSPNYSLNYSKFSSAAGLFFKTTLKMACTQKCKGYCKTHFEFIGWKFGYTADNLFYLMYILSPTRDLQNMIAELILCMTNFMHD